MNNQEYKKKLMDFIKNTTWDNLDISIQNQTKKCFLDLAGVLCAGSKNNSSKKAAQYVEENFPKGNCTILATGKKTNLVGAALANGMSANALDMDDGFSLLRGHPGAGFFGALISAAEESRCSYGQFLSALVVAYEVSIRNGFAIRDFYKWDHSSGCYSAFGTAAAVGKLLNLNDQELEMALGIADFIAPLNPAKRSCFVPSMNKDGIYYGQHVGVQAVKMAQAGITGKNPVILDDAYFNQIDSLGEKYYLFDLYIKFYSCCRWAHSPICAVSDLMNRYDIDIEQIEKIDIFSFGFAGTLYKNAPTNEDEAQYNIKYPIAAQVLFGNCGPLESSTTKMLDSRIPSIIEKIDFYHEPEYDKVFPGKRLSRVEITLENGQKIISDPVEPRGDKNSEISLEDIKEKFYEINEIYAPREKIDNLVKLIFQTQMDESFESILHAIHELAITNVHPEIVFI